MTPASPPNRTTIEWNARAEPLIAVAVCAFGPESGRLATAAMAALAHGRSLTAALGDDAILVRGETDALPWVDGAVYLGDVDGVLLPCVNQPVDEAAVVRAAHTKGTDAELVAVLPERLLRIERPRPPVDVSRLTAYAERWQ